MHARTNKTHTAIYRTIHSGHEVNLQDDFIQLDIRQCRLSLMEIIINLKILMTIIGPIIGHPKGNQDQRLSHYLNNVDHNIEADPPVPILGERTKLQYGIRKGEFLSNSKSQDSQA